MLYKGVSWGLRPRNGKYMPVYSDPTTGVTNVYGVFIDKREAISLVKRSIDAALAFKNSR